MKNHLDFRKTAIILFILGGLIFAGLVVNMSVHPNFQMNNYNATPIPHQVGYYQNNVKCPVCGANGSDLTPFWGITETVNYNRINLKTVYYCRNSSTEFTVI